VTGVDALTDSYDPKIKARNLERSRASSRFRFEHRDLLDLNPDLLRDAELVYHLAARPGVRTSWGEEFAEYVRSNILGTQRVLEQAKRVVFASSSSVYGETRMERVPESHPKNPLSPYGVTKLAAEQLCAVYSTQGRAQTISLRLFTVYGPRQRPDMAFQRLIEAALTGTRFTLYGDGKQRRDFTFVQDVIGAMVLAGKTQARPEAFNIAGGGIVSMNEVIAMVEGIIGRTIAIERVRSQSGDVWHTGADLSRSREILGYAPSTTLRDGLKAQIEAAEKLR